MAVVPVSIVVPTRNRRDSVLTLVRSLSRQSGVAVQLVVVVEGSTDGTLEALADCGLPNLEVVYHPEPRGVSAARNAGLARSEAEYVGFIDDDDFWSPTRVSDAIEAMRSDAQGAAWSSCGVVGIDSRMNVTGFQPAPAADTVVKDLYRGNAIPGGGSAVIARTELIRAAGGFSPEFADLADWDLWLRLIRLSPLATVPQYQIAYTFDALVPTHTRPARAIDELARLQTKHHFGAADLDAKSWNRWIYGQYWRAQDRRGMVGMSLREASRSHNPLHLGRAVAHRVLPMDAQLIIAKARRRYMRRKFDPLAVRAAERWLADVRS